MDEVVAEKYRRLMDAGFPNAGPLEDPSMFIDAKTEGVDVCGRSGSDYMNIYIKVDGDIITDISYLCSCEPSANVVIEALCNMTRGQTIQFARGIVKEDLFEAVGSDIGSVRRKVWGMIELLNRVLNRYEVALARKSQPEPSGGETLSSLTD